MANQESSMSMKPTQPAPDALRRRAEDQLRQQPPQPPPPEPSASVESRRLLHQLQVHEIELEMQNETLRQTQVDLENLANEQAAHLRELAGELTCAEQNERDRLHELLHDEVQPLLVAARLSLSGLGPQTAREDCLRVAAEACEHLGHAIRMARDLSQRLNPPLIRERGLNAGLTSLCGWVKENLGLEVDLTSTPDAEPDDMALRLLCFNATRELLMNVAKHAGTARVALTLRRSDGNILLISVADCGSGFDPDAITRGSGLAAIGRRLGMIGGGLHIDSRPGQGTVATLTVPLGQVAAGMKHHGKHHAENSDRG